jgi:lipoprotein-anchoring transpeptidase ErfK/SrfK
MRRICMSALVVSACVVPALADPLQIAPETTNVAQPQPASAAPPSAGRSYAAAQPNLGGGFIEFLFGGSRETASAPPSNRAPAEAQAPAEQRQASFAVNDPDGADSNWAGAEHAPVDPKYDRQVVAYQGKEQPGTIVIDTPNKFLYLVEDGGKALRYGIGVGRPGFTWAGVKTITAKREWPDWRPPQAMLKRQPELPRFMAGGEDNPLGARAMYLGATDYRIHGSNEPWTIGHNVSSGCIRLRNADVIDLYNRVKVGTKVVVM